MAELIAHGLMLLGGFFVLTAGVGMLRMPDFFCRIHPAGMGDSIGLPMILVGLILMREQFDLVAVKLILLILFSMVTSSTASHALAKAAIVSGLKPLGAIRNKQGRARYHDPENELKEGFVTPPEGKLAPKKPVTKKPATKKGAA